MSPLLLLRVTLLLLVGGAFDRAFRRRSAADRHARWVLVLAAAAGLPVLAILLPGLPVLPIPMAHGDLPSWMSMGRSVGPELRGPLVTGALPAGGEGASAGETGTTGVRLPRPIEGSLPGTAGLHERNGAHGRVVTVPRWFVGAWLAGILLLGGVGAAAFVSGARLVGAARPVPDSDLPGTVADAVRALRIGKSVAVRESGHPGVWYGWRRLRAEGERACDDRVLLAGVAPDRYASHLLAVAREARESQRSGWPAAIAMARPGELEGRLLDVLAPERDRRPPSRRHLALVSAATLMVAVTIAAAEPAPLEAVDEALPAVGEDASPSAPPDTRAPRPVPEGAALRGPRIVEWPTPEGGRVVALVRGTVTFHAGGTEVRPIGAGSSMAVKEYDRLGGVRDLYLVQARNGGARATGWGWPRSSADHGRSASARRLLEQRILPEVWSSPARSSPLTPSTILPYHEREPALWSEVFEAPGWSDRRFIDRASALIQEVLPEADDTVIREAAMEVWAHLNLWILWPSGGGNVPGAPPITVSGHGHMTLLGGDMEAPMVDVSTVVGPMEVALPPLVRRRLEDAGMEEQARLAGERGGALAEAGAETASWWERTLIRADDDDESRMTTNGGGDR